MRAPLPGEYADFYAGYVRRATQLVQERTGDVLDELERSGEATRGLLEGFGEEGAGLRYAPDKWSVKQVLGHVRDSERVFAYRALSFARGEAAPLPGYDQDAYVAQAGDDRRTLADLLDEHASVRRASLTLLRGLPPGAEERVGTANGLRFGLAAVPYVMLGHELHHVDVLRDRYLPLLSARR